MVSSPGASGTFSHIRNLWWEEQHDGRKLNPAPLHSHSKSAGLHPWGTRCFKLLFLRFKVVTVISVVLRRRRCGLYHGPAGSDSRARTRSQSKAVLAEGNVALTLKGHGISLQTLSWCSLQEFYSALQGLSSTTSKRSPVASSGSCKLQHFQVFSSIRGPLRAGAQGRLCRVASNRQNYLWFVFVLRCHWGTQRIYSWGDEQKQVMGRWWASLCSPSPSQVSCSLVRFSSDKQSSGCGQHGQCAIFQQPASPIILIIL